MEDAGLAVRRDAVGNVMGRVGDGGAPLVLGSHSTRSRTQAGTTGHLACSPRMPSSGECGAGPALARGPCSPTRRGRGSASRTSGSAAYTGASTPRGSTSWTPRGSRSPRRFAPRGATPTGRRRPPAVSWPATGGAHRAGARARGGGLPVGVVSAIAGQTRAQVTLTRARGARGDHAHAGAPRRASRPRREMVLAVERRDSRRTGSLQPWASWTSSPVRRTSSLAGRGSRSTCVTPTTTSSAPGCGGDPLRRRADRCRRGVELEWVTLVENDAGVEMAPDAAYRLAAAVPAMGTRSTRSSAAPGTTPSSCPASAPPRCCSSGAPGDQPRPPRVGRGGGRRRRARRARARRAPG